MKKLETNHNGGLRLNWDDIRWSQNGIIDSLNSAVKAIANQTQVFIMSGCDTRRWVGYGNQNGSFIDFELSSGVICINGELFNFPGFVAPGYNIPSTCKFWFVIDIAYDPIGVKTDKYYQQEHQCYADRYVRIELGDSYPTGVSGIDYYPIVKHTIDNKPNLMYLYEILEENLQKKTIQNFVTPLNNWLTQNLKFTQNGKLGSLSGHVIQGAGDEQTGTYICQFSGSGNVNTYNYFTVRRYSSANVYKGECLMYVLGNKLYIENVSDASQGDIYMIGITFIMQ